MRSLRPVAGDVRSDLYRSCRTVYRELAPHVDETERAALLAACLATLEKVRVGKLSPGAAADELGARLPARIAIRGRAVIHREARWIARRAKVS